MYKLILAITLTLSMSANAAKPSKGQREAVIAGVTVATLALTMNPFITVIVITGLDKGMAANLRAGRRNKRHTKSGR